MNRGFFALPTMSNSKGVYTNAVLGFLNIFFKIYEEEKPTHIAVAFDVHQPTFRHKKYADYKAGRRAMPDELRPQFPLIKEVLASMNIACVEQGGIEADDIIGTFSVNAEKEGMDVTVISGDRDLLQLVSDKIVVRIPKTKAGKTVVEDYRPQDVMDTYGVTPLEFIDVKGLMGDSSDNIPGVMGIGEKTAGKLISEYHSIENLYNNIDEMKASKLKDKLVSGKESAEFSKWLATIKTDCDIERSIDSLVCSKEDIFSKAAHDKLAELELKSILKRFTFEEAAKAEIVIDIRNVSSVTELKNIILTSYNKGITNIGLNPVISDGDLIAVSCSVDGICYIMSGMEITENELKAFINEMMGAGVTVSFLSLKEYINMLNLEESKSLFDVSVAAYLVRFMKSYEYDSLANLYLDTIIPDEKTLMGKKELTAFSCLDDDIRRLFAYKAYVADRLCPILSEKLKEDGLEALYTDIEFPMIFVLNDMETLGIRMDTDVLTSYGESLKQRINELEEEIYQLAGEKFNINSPKQLGVILFEKLELKSGKKTKTGYSTNYDVLVKLKNDHPIIDKILEYRSLTKLMSTYVEGLVDSVKSDGRIHSKFNQTITATGRLSSTEPNLQNIPMRTEEGREIRKAFKPKKGYTFVDADYSQIELRVMAHLSNDEALIDAFNQGDDIHAITASKVFNVPLEDVDSLLRRRAKAVNFGIIYGISSFGLGEDLGISRKEASQYIEDYFATYKGVKSFLDKTVDDAKKQGFVRTLYGRKREIPELKSGNFMQRQFGERVAMNSPIQGTAADIIKIAMVNIRRALSDAGLESRLILQIHDELLIEAKDSEVDEVKRLLRDAMENAAELRVPLYIDMHQGESLYDAK